MADSKARPPLISFGYRPPVSGFGASSAGASHTMNSTIFVLSCASAGDANFRCWKYSGRGRRPGWEPGVKPSRPLRLVCANSVEKLRDRILLAISGRVRVCRRIDDSVRWPRLNHCCAKAAPKYSCGSFSTQSAHSGHSAASSLSPKAATRRGLRETREPNPPRRAPPHAQARQPRESAAASPSPRARCTVPRPRRSGTASPNAPRSCPSPGYRSTARLGR